jgi:hypothetical protein
MGAWDLEWLGGQAMERERRRAGRWAGVAIVIAGWGGGGLLPVQAGDEGLSATVSTPAEAAGPRAEAGEDEIGVVGRRVRLDGSLSRSGGPETPGFRWVQVAGPEVRDWREEGSQLSFVPATVGIYRFALVVASGSAISAPDVVEVQVGTWTGPPGTGSVTATAAAVEPSLVRTSAEGPVPTLAAVPIDAVARVALGGVTGGPERGEALALAFEAAADRVGLYGSYQELWSELGRRLEPIVPTGAAQREEWVSRLFGPLTNAMVGSMRQHGLDLTAAAGQTATLTASQKAAMAELFRSMARGFRAGRTGMASSATTDTTATVDRGGRGR